MAAAYRLRLDVTFGSNGDQSAANAGKVPFIGSGTNTEVGLASNGRVALSNTDTFILTTLHADGGKQLLIFTVSTSAANLLQGFFNTRANGIAAGGASGYVEIDFSDYRGTQLSAVISGHAAFYSTTSKIEVTLYLSPPTRA